MSSLAIWYASRGHHQPVHRLDAPAALDELGREPVEQFRMRRPLAHLAEVARRAHDAFAEVMLPDPVHHDARGQRILRRRKPLGESAPPPGRWSRPAAARERPLASRLATESTPGFITLPLRPGCRDAGSRTAAPARPRSPIDIADGDTAPAAACRVARSPSDSSACFRCTSSGMRATTSARRSCAPACRSASVFSICCTFSFWPSVRLSGGVFHATCMYSGSLAISRP